MTDPVARQAFPAGVRLRHLIPMVIVALVILFAAPADASWVDTVQAQATTSAGTLTAPAGLTCRGTLAAGTLSWNQVTGATSYDVVTPGGVLTSVLNSALTLVGGVLSYALPAVSLGTYKVRAVILGTTWVSPYSSTTSSLDSHLNLSCT